MPDVPAVSLPPIRVDYTDGSSNQYSIYFTEWNTTYSFVSTNRMFNALYNSQTNVMAIDFSYDGWITTQHLI